MTHPVTSAGCTVAVNVDSKYLWTSHIGRCCYCRLEVEERGTKSSDCDCDCDSSDSSDSSDGPIHSSDCESNSNSFHQQLSSEWAFLSPSVSPCLLLSLSIALLPLSSSRTHPIHVLLQMRLHASSSLAALWLVTILTSNLLLQASSFSITSGGDVPDFDSSLQVSPDPSSLVSPTASASPSLPVIKVERHLSNVTKHSGESVTLKCEFSCNVESVHPKIAWYKNEAPVEPDKSKLIIKTSKTAKGTFTSRLIVNRLDVHDTGFYKCEAVNPLTDEITESLGILQVEGSTHNYGSSQSIPQFDPIISEFPGLHTER